MADVPRIKLCGLREPEHGALAGRLGVWAIGVMFAAGSPRLVDVDTARAVIAATPPEVARVGVFTTADVAEIARIARAAELTHVQLHGTVDIAAVREATGLPVIAGFGVATADDLAVAADCEAELILLDAKVAGHHGGTGQTSDWDLIAQGALARPYLLAGGLTPHNVADAIARTRPWGVDVSSGVESTRGVKDSERMVAFVRAVREQSEPRSGV